MPSIESPKFTPGPWFVVLNGCALQGVQSSDGNWLTYKAGERGSVAEVEANAHLIAAAPELYDGCAAFVDACHVGLGINPDWSDERIYDELPSSILAGAYFKARAALTAATPPLAGGGA